MFTLVHIFRPKYMDIYNIVFSKFVLKAEYFQTKRKSLIMRKLKENNKKTHLSYKII